MRYYRVTKTVTHQIETIVLAPDEDAAYDIAYDLSPDAWMDVPDSVEIDRKPDTIRDVTPPELVTVQQQSESYAQ